MLSKERVWCALTTTVLPTEPDWNQLEVQSKPERIQCVYGVLGTKSLALKPWSCCALHLHRLLYQCILVLSTSCQLGPSERILNLAAAAFFGELGEGMRIQTLAGNLLTSAYFEWILCYLKQPSGNFTANFLYAQNPKYTKNQVDGIWNCPWRNIHYSRFIFSKNV